MPNDTQLANNYRDKIGQEKENDCCLYVENTNTNATIKVVDGNVNVVMLMKNQDMIDEFFELIKKYN